MLVGMRAHQKAKKLWNTPVGRMANWEKKNAKRYDPSRYDYRVKTKGRPMF